MSLEESQLRQKSAGRNDPCPCGSGKKYKKCHYAEDQAALHEDLVKQRAVAEAAAEAAAAAESEEAKKAGTKKPAGGTSVAQKAKGPQASAKPAKGRSAGAQAGNLPRRGAV